MIGEMIGQQLVLEVTNPAHNVRYSMKNYENMADMDGFLPASAFLSTHPNGGRGLPRADGIARQYGGSVSFRFFPDERLFYTRIVLPNQRM